LRTVCLYLLLAPPAWAEPPRTDDHGDPLPPGAVARLGTLRLRDGAACVAFSPDGKTLVSGCDGLCAWDVATGKNLGWFPTAAPATSAQFSPDGKSILTIDNKGAIRLWQTGTGKLLREPKQPQDNLFFPGNNSFLSANGKVAGVTGVPSETGVGSSVHLWETDTGKQILTRKEGRSLFFSATLSPDGKTLVVRGESNLAHLLEVATGKEVRLIQGPNKAPHLPPGLARSQEESLSDFAFSPDGKTLAGGSGKNSFSLWNVADGRLRFTIKDRRGRLAFSQDGKHLMLYGGYEPMRLYETATGKQVQRFERHPGYMHAIAFSPDGKTVATTQDYTITFWDVATGKRQQPFAGHVTPVISLAFSPDGSDLASGDRGEGTLIVWRLKDRKPRHVFGGHKPNVLSLAYSPDGKVLATGDGYHGSGSDDAHIRLWDLTAGQLLRQFPGHLNGVANLTFSPDGKRLASGGHDAWAKVWDVSTGKRLLQIRGEDDRDKSPSFSPDGKTLLVAGSPGKLALWRLDSGQKVRDFETPRDENRTILSVAFLSGGRMVLTREFGAGRPIFNEARFWDAENGRLLRSFSVEVTNQYPRCLALSADGKMLATGGDSGDPIIQLWDTTTGNRVGRFIGHNGGEAARSLAFSPDGKTLASGGEDTTVLLWDVALARLEHLWAELAAGQDEDTQASKKLAAAPEDAIPFLKDRLRRAAAAEERARRLIADLDDAFEVREKASQELEGLGPEVAFPLRLALKGAPSAEARMRLQKALDKIKTPQGEHNFQPRTVSLALAVLEEIGTPEARRALEELAKGPAQAVVTHEAGAALERLAKRRKP